MLHRIVWNADTSKYDVKFGTGDSQPLDPDTWYNFVVYAYNLYSETEPETYTPGVGQLAFKAEVSVFVGKPGRVCCQLCDLSPWPRYRNSP